MLSSIQLPPPDEKIISSSATDPQASSRLFFTAWILSLTYQPVSPIVKMNELTFVRYSLLRAVSISRRERSALWSWASRRTRSTSAFVNSKGGSENVTVPVAEIWAEISDASICKNFCIDKGTNRKGRTKPHHTEDDSPNPFLAIYICGFTNFNETQSKVSGSKLFDCPSRCTLKRLAYQPSVLVLFVG